MLNRITRYALVGVFATAIAGYGTAYAQDDDDEDMGEGVGDEEGMGETTGEGTGEGEATTEEGEGGEKAAVEEGGGESAATPQKAGDIHAGAVILFPGGIGDDGEYGIGKYIELRPWGSYAVNEKISAGAVIPLLVVSPDFGDNSLDLLQGIMAWGDYAVNDKITAGAMVGMARPARMGINPFGGAATPGTPGDLKAGFAVGAGYMHKAGKIKAHAGVDLVFQLDSDTNDSGEETMGMWLQVPVAVLYAVNEKLDAGVKTGLYTGAGFSFDTNDYMTLPLMLVGKYAVNDAIKAGAMLGFGSLLVPDGEFAPGMADTLSFGVFVGWSKK